MDWRTHTHSWDGLAGYTHCIGQLCDHVTALKEVVHTYTVSPYFALSASPMVLQATPSGTAPKLYPSDNTLLSPCSTSDACTTHMNLV